jgi:hypothetical protein
MTLRTMRPMFAAGVLPVAGCGSINVSTVDYPNVGDFPPTFADSAETATGSKLGTGG